MVLKRFAGFVLAAGALLLVSSCEYRRAEIGPMHDEPVSIDLGGVERANVQLNMAAGELVVRGGAQKLLQGRFEYNIAAWKPKVTYSASGSSADVLIKQPEGSGGFGNRRNSWDLELNDKVLL